MIKQYKYFTEFHGKRWLCENISEFTIIYNAILKKLRYNYNFDNRLVKFNETQLNAIYNLVNDPLYVFYQCYPKIMIEITRGKHVLNMCAGDCKMCERETYSDCKKFITVKASQYKRELKLKRICND